jgi:GTP-binding protein
MNFSISIVGRPNVGKSTLFNRLTGRQHAIVHDRPGVTRDRREGQGKLAGLEFHLVDTAGLEESAKGSLEDRMRRQTEYAIANSDLTLLIFDARSGLTEADIFFAKAIRRSGASVLAVGNKCEGKAGRDGLMEAWQLGLDQPIGVSAAHGEGLGDLYDAIVDAAKEMGKLDLLMPDYADEKEDDFDEETELLDAAITMDAGNQSLTDMDDDADLGLAASQGLGEIDDQQDTGLLRIAIIGRPNMGKSTLANYLLGEERVLTGPEAGITRDAIEIPFIYKEQNIMLVDTAGMRRKARIEDKVEKAMVDDALRAIRFAHVCIVMIDAREDIHRQDLAIARLVAEEGRAMVIAANMWDITTNKQERLKEMRYQLDQSLGQVKGVPVATVSSLKGQGIDKLMDHVFTIYDRWNWRISTADLNRWLDIKLEAHPPPLVQGRRLRIRYATQIKTRPPSFALFVSRPADLPEHYLRYLAAGLRDDFGLDGLPLRLLMRKGNNPYVN